MHTLFPRALALAVASALMACQATAAAASASASTSAASAPTSTAPSVRADNAYLSQTDAAARSARVSNVDYVLEFVLTGKERFAGRSTLSFDLADASQPLTIDLDKADISSLSVNGKTVTPQYNHWFITLSP